MSNTVDEVLKQVDDLAIATMNEHTIPGMAVGIVHRGELVYGRGFGWADAERGIPVTPDTVFRIGSISKTFTAIGVMQLWEQGKVQLEDPVHRHLRAFTVQHRDRSVQPVTVHHMLTHRSGIGMVRNNRVWLTCALTQRPWEIRPRCTLAEYYHMRLVPELPPGEKWAYSNAAYASLGQLVEDVSGQPFSQYMREHVFKSLGMRHSDYSLSDRVRDTLAQGYIFPDGSLAPIRYLENPRAGAGSIHSSLNDMARYTAALMNGGQNEHGTVLRPETLQMMTTPQVQPDPHLLGMGLGFFLAMWGTHRLLWHGGGQPGFRSSLYVAPDAGLGVVTLTNCETAGHEQLATDLMRRLLDAPDPKLPPAGVLASPHLWSEFCGFYGPGKGFQTNTLVNLSFGGEFQVYTHGIRLMLRSLAGGLEKGLVLHPLDGEDPLVLGAQVGKDLVPVVFKRDATGKVDRFHLGLRHFGLYELRKYPKGSRAWYGARALKLMLRALSLAGRVWRKLSTALRKFASSLNGL